MEDPWYSGEKLEPQKWHFEVRHKWSLRLMLADGLARRLEESLWEWTPPVYVAWTRREGEKPAPSPGELRKQLAALIHGLVPIHELSEAEQKFYGVSFPLFAAVYGHPLFVSGAFMWAKTENPGLFQSETPPPLTLLLAQTGFPHALIAAHTLSVIHPVQDENGRLHRAWALFYQRQLLEWEVRHIWLEAIWKKLGDRKVRELGVPDAWREKGVDSGVSANIVSTNLPLVLWALDNGQTPVSLEKPYLPSLLYTPDWFERSWAPDSVYQKRREGRLLDNQWLPDAFELVNRLWETCPRLAQCIGLCLEQHLMLLFLSPLEKLFRELPMEILERDVSSIYGPAVWSDWMTVRASGATREMGEDYASGYPI